MNTDKIVELEEKLNAAIVVIKFLVSRDRAAIRERIDDCLSDEGERLSESLYALNILI